MTDNTSEVIAPRIKKLGEINIDHYLPPNFDKLDDEDKIICKEDLYRRQIMSNHGFIPGEYQKITQSKCEYEEVKKDEKTYE